LFRGPCLLVYWTRALLACPLTVLVGPRCLSVCSLVDRTLACCLRVALRCSFVDIHWPRPILHEIFLLVLIVQCCSLGAWTSGASVNSFLVQTLMFSVDDVGDVSRPTGPTVETLAALIGRRTCFCCCAYSRRPRPPAGRRSVDLGR